MSSATSIEKVQPSTQGALPAEGFRAWHFFLLASVLAATAAVVIARQSTPEHLVLLSLTIGAAGAAAAGFYRTLAPLAAEDVTLFSEPLTERKRAALDREKTLVLRSIKELEFDRAMGKLSPRDFEEMSARLRARALSLIKELDASGSGYSEIIERELKARIAAAPARAKTIARSSRKTTAAAENATDHAGRTCACGTANDPDAAFCKRCGVRLS